MDTDENLTALNHTIKRKTDYATKHMETVEEEAEDERME